MLSVCGLYSTQPVLSVCGLYSTQTSAQCLWLIFHPNQCSVSVHGLYSTQTSAQCLWLIFHPNQCSVSVAYEIYSLQLSGQLEVLASVVSMTTATMRAVLCLCGQLETRLRVVFPTCSLLPFGSLITGLGTLTSDADLALLLDTPSHITQLLSPQQYYPPMLYQLSQQSLSVEPPSPTHSTHSTPERPMRCDSSLKAVAGVVRGLSDCERVFVIESARCPIVRFYHRPSALHVDLSLDNRCVR